MIKHGKQDPEHAFNITSNLNWYRYEKQIKIALQFGPMGSVLDIGCGWGHTTAMLAASYPEAELVGLDMARSPTWNNLRGYGPQFVVSDALALPFAPETFDVVISFGAMEHTDDAQGFLNSVSRVLKNGGYCIIFNLPNKYAFSEWCSDLLGLWHHDRKYTRKEVANLLTATGFSIIKLGREHIVPAQVDRISKRIGKMFNRIYPFLDSLDSCLSKTPLIYLAEDHMLCARKLENELE